MLNLVAGWTAVLVGLISGTVIGSFFHQEGWLGGYGSWRRRMLRLMHVAFVGTGLLNLAFGMTVGVGDGDPVTRAASVLFVAGAVTMPLVCGLSAWRPGLRQLFFIPVVSLIGATGSTLYRLLAR